MEGVFLRLFNLPNPATRFAVEMDVNFLQRVCWKEKPHQPNGNADNERKWYFMFGERHFPPNPTRELLEGAQRSFDAVENLPFKNNIDY